MLLDLDFDVAHTGLHSASLSASELASVQQFLTHEARLLDERRWDEWLALWTDGGMYWIPQQQGQLSPYKHISLAWEDSMLREVRARRLEHPRNWSQQPRTRAARLVGNLSVEGRDNAGYLVLRSVFHMSEWRKSQRQWAGVYWHKLQSHGDTWRIHMKRVDLINCDAVHENIEVFI